MSVNFDGNDAYFTTNTSGIPGTLFTITFWLKFNTLPGDGIWANIMYMRNSGGSEWFLEYNGSDSDLNIDGLNTDVTGIQTGVWYRCALVRNGSNSAYYMSSATTGSIGSALATGTLSIPSSPNRFSIAASGSSSTSEELNGRMVNLKIWNRVLSTTEIVNELGTYNVLDATSLLRHHKWQTAGGVPDGGTGGSLTAVGTPTTSTDTPQPLQYQTITTTGIGSGQAFGATQVKPGPITLGSAGGIDSALAFGSHKVAPIISPTGIPSQERFGRSHMDGKVHPNGIESALRFGTLTVVSGPVTLSPLGIPRPPITFGTAVVLGSVIAPTGIPSSPKLFGTPTITRGPVTLTSVGGIDSAIRFGATRVERETVALRHEILARPRPRVVYEVVCVSRIPQVSGPPVFFEISPIEFTSLQYTEKISSIPTLNLSSSISTLTEEIKQRLREPSDLGTEIWVYRNGKLMFAGPWVGIQVQGENLSISVDGLLSYLASMMIHRDWIFKNTDQFSIVKQLIDDRQALPHSNLGIDTSGIGTSGITRTITYLRNEGNFVLNKVLELGKAANGFDILIDPSSRKLELYHPQVGVDRSSGPEAIVFDDRNVTDTNIMLSLAPQDLATDFHAVGTGTGQDSEKTFWSYAFNEQLRAQFGRVDYFTSFQDISSQAQLDQLVQAIGNARLGALWIPGPNVRVTPDADLSNYDVGDTVSYTLHNELGVQGAFRLLSRTVSVEDGTETVSASFV